MQISGVNKLTLIDFPGRTACIFFTPGCNFRCGYCHNPEFVLPEQLCQIRKSFIPEAAVWEFLRERRGRLEGVVITGGEPTIQPDLERFIGKVKKLGYLVKLDTNGNKPDVLKRLVEKKLVDYVAMDVKTSPKEYPDLVGKLANILAIKESIAYLKSGVIDYEFRTTLIKEKHPLNILNEMKDALKGAKRLYLQTFRNTIVLDPAYASCQSFSLSELEDVKRTFESVVESVMVREG